MKIQMEHWREKNLSVKEILKYFKGRLKNMSRERPQRRPHRFQINSSFLTNFRKLNIF